MEPFYLQTDAPDPSRLPEGDVVGVTVILLTCLYRDKVSGSNTREALPGLHYVIPSA